MAFTRRPRRIRRRQRACTTAAEDWRASSTSRNKIVGASSVGTSGLSGRALSRGRATVRAVSRTQNTFTLDVDATEEARILLNSTYDRGFRTDVGALAPLDKQL